MSKVREYRAAGLGAAVVAVYLILVLGSGRVDQADFGQLLLNYLKASFALWIVVGLFINLTRFFAGARRSGREPFLIPFLKSFLTMRWEQDRCVSLLWPPLLFALLMASFNTFKQMILPLAGFRFDPLLSMADRALFLGVDPWRVTHAIFGSSKATSMIDSAYHGWFVPMSVGLVVCAYLPSSHYRLRTQYLLTYIGVWIGIGSVLAFLVPAAGPCFYSELVAPSASFDALHRELLSAQAATGAPFAALTNQAMLLHALGSDTLQVGGGISAMPSVHNALAALFALGAYRLNRTLGWTFAAYAGLIWIGSIHLGWHYAVDGIVAIALTLLLWRAAGWLADAFEKPERVPQGQPATA
jgi:hypothetical protein